MASEIWYNDGGTERRLKEIWYNDGGTERSLKEVWYNDGGTERQVFGKGGTGALQDAFSYRHTRSFTTVTSPDTKYWFNYYSQVHFDRDGGIWVTNGDARKSPQFWMQRIGNWYDPNLVDAALAYDMRLTAATVNGSHAMGLVTSGAPGNLSDLLPLLDEWVLGANTPNNTSASATGGFHKKPDSSLEPSQNLLFGRTTWTVALNTHAVADAASLDLDFEFRPSGGGAVVSTGTVRLEIVVDYS